MPHVLANVPVNGPVVFYDWVRQDCSWSYVSLWLDGNQSDVILFVNWRWELILAESDSLVNSSVELGLVCMLCPELGYFTSIMKLLYIWFLLGRTNGWRPLVLYLRKRENVLLISGTIEITSQAGDTCSYRGAKTRSSHIYLRILGELHTNGLDKYWISRPNSTSMASPIVSGD
jgi:hypothetical protein